MCECRLKRGERARKTTVPGRKFQNKIKAVGRTGWMGWAFFQNTVEPFGPAHLCSED